VELVRLASDAAKRVGVARLANERPIVFFCRDADTVMVASSMAGELTAPLGVWLRVGVDYSAQLAARDVKTLAALILLRDVVVEAPSLARAHAEVVRAMLTNDEVNLTNDVARIEGAYNRPAPRAPVTVWSFEDGRLLNGDDVLTAGEVVTDDVGEWTTFAD
jgi:hypothetical protein